MKRVWTSVTETTTRRRPILVPDDFDCGDTDALLELYRDSGPGEELEDVTVEEVTDVQVERLDPPAGEFFERRREYRRLTA